MDSMDITTLLYDHYKATFELSKKAQTDRDKYFIILCVLITLLFLFSIDPNSVIFAMKSIIKEQYKIEINFNFNILQSLLWLLTFFFTTKYYQKVIYIERQYPYIDSLEGQISNSTKEINNIFKRESSNYLKHYPIILNFIDAIYKLVFPILYIAVTIFKLILDWKYTISILNSIFNTIIGISIIVITILYLVFIYDSNKKQD